MVDGSADVDGRLFSMAELGEVVVLTPSSALLCMLLHAYDRELTLKVYGGVRYSPASSCLAIAFTLASSLVLTMLDRLGLLSPQSPEPLLRARLQQSSDR